MNSNSEFQIFREARRSIGAADLVVRLRAELRQHGDGAQLDQLLSLLLLAGELECALRDAQASTDAVAAAQLTDLFSDAALAPDSSRQQLGSSLQHAALRILNEVRFRGTVNASAPEGFAYYALHPLDYADLIARVKVPRARAFVIGIRSIGTTLSAVVTAKLRQLGNAAERTTIRPTGHPYQRQCKFDFSQREAISPALTADAEFLVCDEGPGRSGSSLLSVAEALEREGVPRSRILELCSCEPDVSSLCAPDAARRWLRYRSAATGMTQRLPPDAQEYLGGGEWRRRFIAQGEAWPAVWSQMERLKCLSADGQELLTFEGYGPYGTEARARNEELSNSGFGAPYLGHEAGFGRHLLPPGRLARRDDLASNLLAHIAEYCAWRARKFCAEGVNCGQLESMVSVNFQREFGEPLEHLTLKIERPATCDNRMAPHSWLFTTGGRWLKLDAAIHGADHFFPGPCDIAWDLAGIIVEWKLSSSARDFLISKYRAASGDDVKRRLQNYELAYTMFRLAWSKMAAASVAGTEEEARLLGDYRRYRRALQRLTCCRTRQSRPQPCAVPLPESPGTSAALELP